MLKVENTLFNVYLDLEEFDLSFKDLWNSQLKRVNNALVSFLDEKIKEAEEISPVNFQFYKDIKEFVLRGGKRLRSVGLVFAYEGVGAKYKGDVYRASLCVELLHNSTLVHDDIIDHDELRRGGPTFHVLYRDRFREEFGDVVAEDFGVAMGILGGDLIWNLGLEAILTSGFPSDQCVEAAALFQKAFQDVVDGVLYEAFLAKRRDVGEEEYMLMIKLKTACLFEKSLLIGAVLGGGTEKQMKALSSYAIKVGQAFQIQDDILGSFGKEEVTGKPADGDIKEGKKTILVVKALETLEEKEREKMLNILGRSDATPDEVNFVRDMFVKSGALDYAKKKAFELKDEAKELLKQADPPLSPDAEKFFLDLADFVVSRIY